MLVTIIEREQKTQKSEDGDSTEQAAMQREARLVRAPYGGSFWKTTPERPLIGNGDSVIITNERHKAELLYARRVEPRVYRPLPCAQRMAGGFLFNRKLRSLLNKNAPRRSHCGGKTNY